MPSPTDRPPTLASDSTRARALVAVLLAGGCYVREPVVVQAGLGDDGSSGDGAAAVTWAPGSDGTDDGAPACGNGAIEPGETCDGFVPPSLGCATFGHGSGTLACTDECTISTDGCDMGSTTSDPTGSPGDDTGGSEGGSVCGDGIRDVGEPCDSGDLGGQTCVSLGFAGGDLACNGDCTFATAGCMGQSQCGNGVADGDEVCDGDDLAGGSCASLGFPGGGLACANDCASYSVDGCTPLPYCGDGAVNADEDCEPGLLQGQNCVTLGFEEGTLACNGACGFDTSNCRHCSLVNQPCASTAQCCSGLFCDVEGGSGCV